MLLFVSKLPLIKHVRSAGQRYVILNSKKESVTRTYFAMIKYARAYIGKKTRKYQTMFLKLSAHQEHNSNLFYKNSYN